MGAAMTGMARHGGVLPVGGTFFVFSDYMRPSVRLAALSESHVIYSWTHDSVGLGEDGPTHQPVEHLAALRAMPGLRVIRPADANETAHAWRIAVDSDGPTALVLSRQSLPVLDGTAQAADGVARGGYVLVDPPQGAPEIVLIGTGSEVSVCVEAAALLAGADAPVRARVVSLPSWDLFAAQNATYRDEVLPPAPPDWRSRRRRGSDGSATPTTSWPSTTSERRPPGPSSWSTSATHRRTSRRGPGPCWPGPVRPAPAESDPPPGGDGEGASRPEGSTMTKLHDLYEHQGQSPWLDNLRRDYLPRRPAGGTGGRRASGA